MATPPDGGLNEILERLALLRNFEAVERDHLLSVGIRSIGTTRYVLWSLGVNATPVGESVVSYWRWLLCQGLVRLSGLRFGIGGRRGMLTG